MRGNCSDCPVEMASGPHITVQLSEVGSVPMVGYYCKWSCAAKDLDHLLPQMKGDDPTLDSFDLGQADDTMKVDLQVIGPPATNNLDSLEVDIDNTAKPHFQGVLLAMNIAEYFKENCFNLSPDHANYNRALAHCQPMNASSAVVEMNSAVNAKGFYFSLPPIEIDGKSYNPLNSEGLYKPARIYVVGTERFCHVVITNHDANKLVIDATEADAPATAEIVRKHIDSLTAVIYDLPLEVMHGLSLEEFESVEAKDGAS